MSRPLTSPAIDAAVLLLQEREALEKKRAEWRADLDARKWYGDPPVSGGTLRAGGTQGHGVE